MENKENYHLLEKAISIAIKAHEGQKDKNGMPYILHPLRVMLRGENLDEKICGVLHDTIEDTDVTADFLKDQGFPDHLIEAILLVTRLESETYEEFILRIKKNKLATQVKLYDLKDNLDVTRLDNLNLKDTERLNRYLHALKTLLSE